MNIEDFRTLTAFQQAILEELQKLRAELVELRLALERAAGD